ncbi:MAG: hypothetical protein Q9213_001109 [Squamulea squamosa]
MPTSRRLSLLKKFERQVAPLQKHHVDFLGLGEDTRDEIAYLEKKERVAAAPSSTSSGSANRETRTFGQYGAAVGDVTAFAEEKGHGLKRAERLHDNDTSGEERRGSSVDYARQQQQPITMQRPESLNEPKSSNRWFDLFSRRSRKADHEPHDPATMPPLRLIRTVSPRPSVSAEALPADRPRRRLSKALRRNSSKASSSKNNDTPCIRFQQNLNVESDLDSLRTAIQTMDPAALFNKGKGPRRPKGTATYRRGESNRSYVFNDKAGEVPSDHGTTNDDVNAPSDYPDNGVFGGEVPIPFRRIYDGPSHTFHQNNQLFYRGSNGNANERPRDEGSKEQRGAEVMERRADESQEQHVRFKGENDGGQGEDGEGGSDTDDSVITYNDGTEKGRAKKMRMLEKWNRAREERERQ